MEIKADEINLSLNKGSRIYILPCIAGHVGADAAGVVLAEAPQNGSDVQLLIDVGTNAEIVLGNKDRLLAASSPTGPAFEGAQISSGQRAAPGAIERLRINPETFEPRFSVIGSDSQMKMALMRRFRIPELQVFVAQALLRLWGKCI